MIEKLIELNFDEPGLQRTSIILNQANKNSVVYNFKVRKGVKEADYLSYTHAELVFKLKNGTAVTQNSTVPSNNVTISADGIRCVLNENVFGAVGEVQSYIKLFKNEKISAPLQYGFNVISDLLDITRISKFYIGTIEELVAAINLILEELQNETFVTRKDFDNALKQLVGGSPQGFFPKLVDLQTAHPNGTEGVFVVIEDGKWYIWNGTAWLAGGVYQATQIADGSVNYWQTTFLRNNRNLFNKDTAHIGYFLSNGNLTASTTYTTSDFIRATAGLQYATNTELRFIEYYKSDKSFISSVNNSIPSINSFTTPENSAFFRVTFQKGYKDTVQIELGSVSTDFVKYGYELVIPEDVNAVIAINSPAKIEDNSIANTKLTDGNKYVRMVTSENLFNRNTAGIGYFVNWNLGTLSANSLYIYSDYIPIEPGKSYAQTWSTHIAFYNANLVFTRGFEKTVNPTHFTAGINDYFVRVSWSSADHPWTGDYQFEKGIEPTSYTPFQYKTIESVESSRALFGVRSKNLFNKNDALVGFKLNDSGLTLEDIEYTTSGYINVFQSVTYVSSKALRFIAFYDNDKQMIAGSFVDRNPSTLASFTTPLNAKYARVTISNITLDDVQIEWGKTVTSYESFGFVAATNVDGVNITYPTKIVETYDPVKSSRFYNKKVSWFGTSITAGYEWCKKVNAVFNFHSTNNGVGGTSICFESVGSMSQRTRMLGQYSNIVDPNTNEITYTGVPIPTDVDVIFIEGGTNDWARNWTLGIKLFNQLPNDLEFFGACEKMFRNMTELFPNAEIIVVGTPFGKMPNRGVFPNKYGVLNALDLQSVEYGDMLLDVAGRWGIKGINIGRKMQIHDNNISALIPDGLHLTTTASQQRAADVIVKYLLTI